MQYEKPSYLACESKGFRTFFDSVSFRLLRDAAKVIQENHYYPFGQNMVGIEELDQQSLSSQEEQKFQYNAKEKLDEFGLYWNDHGARNLDLQTGRWTSVDPLAEKFSPMSPYVAMGNNPVMFLDRDGREIRPVLGLPYKDKSGKVVNTITFNASITIYNTTGKGNDNNTANAFKSRLKEAFTGVSEGNTAKTMFKAGDIQVRVVNSMDMVEKSDHLLVITDDVTGFATHKDGSKTRAGGIANMFSKIGYVKSNELNAMVETMIHEFGHMLGLEHNWESSDKADDSDSNYMSYASGRTSFSSSQLLSIFGNKGRINQGQSFLRAEENMSNSGGTSNAKPFRKVFKNEKYPIPIKGL